MGDKRKIAELNLDLHDDTEEVGSPEKKTQRDEKSTNLLCYDEDGPGEKGALNDKINTTRERNKIHSRQTRLRRKARSNDLKDKIVELQREVIIKLLDVLMFCLPFLFTLNNRRRNCKIYL